MHTLSIGARAIAVTAIFVMGSGRAHAALPQGSTGSCSTSRVSLASNGAQGNNDSQVSQGGCISADGNRIVFVSLATNLVPLGGNGASDVFLRDRASGTTLRISENAQGTGANGAAQRPAISANGRFVAFSSIADNLVPADTNHFEDIFVRDLATGTVTRVSLAFGGGESNGPSYHPSLSADGRYIAFESLASNLVIDDTNGSEDVFVLDRDTGVMQRASVDSSGAQADGYSYSYAACISLDGRHVAFTSTAGNLVSDDTNGTGPYTGLDVFVHDFTDGVTTRASVSSAGAQANDSSGGSTISADGRYVAFASRATNLIPNDTNGNQDIFRHDNLTGETLRVSVGSTGIESASDCFDPCISADGRYVAFSSPSPELVPGDSNGASDVFVHDCASGATSLWSLGSGDIASNGSSARPSFSIDAHTIVFDSVADDLNLGDTNGRRDVFVRDCYPAAPTAYCIGVKNSAGCTSSIASVGTPSIAPDALFMITAHGILNHTFGMMLYGKSGPACTPFQNEQGGFLCIASPVLRTTAQSAGGNAGLPHDCSGSFSFDFHAFMASAHDAGLIPGQLVCSQYWVRDPGITPAVTSLLSDALEFVIMP